MTNINDIVLQFSPWSISKADLAKKCPKAFAFRYVEKLGSSSGTEARVGTAAHRSIELQRQGVHPVEAEETAVREAKDLTTAELEDLAALRGGIHDYIRRIQEYRTRHGDIVHEAQESRLGVDAKGNAADYNDPKTFFRGSVDDLLEHGTGKGVSIDHKSGKLKTAADYAKQLDGYNVLIVANRPSVKKISSGIHFVRHKHLDWHNTVHRDHVMRTLLPWLRHYIETCARNLGQYEATPTRLCPWCDYIDKCDEGRAFMKLHKLKPRK